ncbi:putative lipoprotein [Corallococcus coralloides DSM 2259]|uniref:Putative lipoprotein n=2 Tax=Corallococcus coralloides TaxID=184914 RepID=H8N176_CORCM|nr:putative lipoprotein [Corallococcus coralloides DSM 2259]
MVLGDAVCEDSGSPRLTGFDGRKRMRLRQGLYGVGVALGLLGQGCQKQEPQTVPMDVPAVPPPARTVPREGPAATAPVVHQVLDVKEDAGKPASPAEAAWTTATVQKPRGEPPSITLRSVRTGTHADYDRTVFEFDGPRLPGYQLGYVKTPVQQCGSGDDVKTPGEAALEVRFTLARAHDDQGQATVAQRSLKPALPSLLGLERVCDFEGEVTWVLGTARRAPFRVLELTNPTRLVLDVQH